MFNLQEYLTQLERDYTALYWAKLAIARIVSCRPTSTLYQRYRRELDVERLFNDARVYAELAYDTRCRLGLPRS